MSDLQNTLDHLPAQFVAPTAAVWTTREQMRAMKMVNDACPGLDGNALSNTLKSASAHFQKRGTLDGWSPKRHSVGSEFARIDREASAQRKAALQAAGFKPRYATAPEVRHVMKTAHDVCMTEGTKPSAAAMLRDAGVPAKEATRLASKGNRNIATEWQAQSQHPARTAMREQGVLTRRKENAATSGTLAGTVAALYSLADHTKDRQRLSAVESRQDAMQREIEALRAQLAQHEVRMDVVDAGLDPRAEALRLHSDGLGYKAIATRIGRSQSTVRNWIKAA